MVIPITEQEKVRLADAVFFIMDIMDRIEKYDELSGIWNVLDEATAHLRAIEDEVNW